SPSLIAIQSPTTIKIRSPKNSESRSLNNIESEMARMPMLHIFCAKLIAGVFILREYPGYYMLKLLRTMSREQEAFASEAERDLSPTILMNQLAFTGFTFAHEMYHQVQHAHNAIIEDVRDHEHAHECVIDYTNRVCSRFTERACSSHFTAIEDTADVYGVQIVFNVMRKMLGTEID
ncbi:hypothetical protein PENTCL1PPCAC_25854, partial [Pristionchus entomophagus]